MNLSNVLYAAANHADRFNHNAAIDGVINTDANNKLIMFPSRNAKGDNLLPFLALSVFISLLSARYIVWSVHVSGQSGAGWRPAVTQCPANPPCLRVHVSGV